MRSFHRCPSNSGKTKDLWFGSKQVLSLLCREALNVPCGVGTGGFPVAKEGIEILYPFSNARRPLAYENHPNQSHLV